MNGGFEPFYCSPSSSLLRDRPGMEFLKKLPNLLKAHYEKVLLGVALFALLGGVAYLYELKQDEIRVIDEYNQTFGKKTIKPVPPLDLTGFQKSLAMATNPPPLDLSKPHHIFNPVKWMTNHDGLLIKIEKGTEVGPDRLKIIKVIPLRFSLGLDKFSGASGYFVSMTSEVARVRLASAFVKLKDRDRWGTNFTVSEERGASTNEEDRELVFKLIQKDNQEAIVKKGHPYVSTEAYRVDLSYPIENTMFPNKATGDTITLHKEDFIIVDIKPDQVVLSARSNNKRYTIRSTVAP